MNLTRKEKFERNDTLRSQRRQQENVDGNDSRQPQKRKQPAEALSLAHSVKVIRNDQPASNRPQPTAINRVIPPNLKSITHNRLRSKKQLEARSQKDSTPTKSFSILSARWSDTDNRSRRVYMGLSQIMKDKIRMHVSSTPKSSRH